MKKSTGVVIGVVTFLVGGVAGYFIGAKRTAKALTGHYEDQIYELRRSYAKKAAEQGADVDDLDPDVIPDTPDPEVKVIVECPEQVEFEKRRAEKIEALKAELAKQDYDTVIPEPEGCMLITREEYESSYAPNEPEGHHVDITWEGGSGFYDEKKHLVPFNWFSFDMVVDWFNGDNKTDVVYLYNADTDIYYQIVNESDSVPPADYLTPRNAGTTHRKDWNT